MSKNGNLKSILASNSKEETINGAISNNKKYLSNKLSEQYLQINDALKQNNSGNNINDYNSQFTNYKNFQSKVSEKNLNNSIKKYEKNAIAFVEEKNNNIRNNNLIYHQHYKNLSNSNEKEIYNFNNKFNQDTLLKKNISNFNSYKNKESDVAKNKTNYQNNQNINKNEKYNFNKKNIYGKNINKYKKKINNNLDNKIEKIFSFINNKNFKNKGIINSISNINYMKTNPNNEKNNNKVYNNCNSDIKSNITINKKYEKSCPKFNINKNNGQNQNNSNIKILNYEQINEENNTENGDNIYIKKPSIEILKSIKGNLMPYYNSTAQNTSNEIINNSNNKNIIGSNQKFNQSKKDKTKNIINFFLPNKEKTNIKQNEDKNNSKIGNLQNIIMNNDDNFVNNDKNEKERINTQTNNINNSTKNNIKINNNNVIGPKVINKSNGLRKIRTINDKNEKFSKKDLTLNNNIVMKKRRPRYFDSEINNNIIDSTNILGNNIKNKSAYLNLIRKAFNNKNKNYYINFMSNKSNKNDINNNNEIITQINNNKLQQNNNFVQKSVRDSKSLNVVRNKSNNNFNNENNIKKIINNEPYINKIMKIINNKDKDRNYSVNEKNNEYNLRKLNFQHDKNILNKKLNNTHNNIGVVNKNEIDENRISENIENNSIYTYSIFIFHNFYKNYGKIGLKKIKIFDINNTEIPVIFYKSNADFDNGKLFNTMMTNKSLFSKAANLKEEIIDDNIPFITEIKKDINIYFHINSNKSNNIKFIQIINTNNKNISKINPVKNIEIFKGQSVIYKGVLNDDINIIQLSFSSSKNINNINYMKDIYQERPFSTSKIRAINNNNLGQTPLNSNIKENNNEIDIYHTARNNLFSKFNYNNNYIEEEYNENENNIKLFSNTDGMNKNVTPNKKPNNSNNSNTINIHINNNTNNITNLEFFEKNEKVKVDNENNSIHYSFQNSLENKKFNEINNDIIDNDKENLIEISNSHNNDNDNNDFSLPNKKLDLTFDKNNSENDYNETDIIEEKVLTNNQNNNQNIKEIYYDDKNFSENNNNTNIINENLIYTNSNLYNTFNNNESNYIYFNRIKLIITSNYGHKKHVGLTGIEFYNIRGELINVEKAIAIGAFPKDLRTIYDDENDNRIFENVFNNTNDTDDPEDMWVTKLKKTEPKTFIELYFKEKIKISKIKFYNYNEKNNLHIGAQTIELYLDNNYYGTIYLKPGVGEIAHDSLGINEDNNKDLDEKNDDSDDGINHFKEDFGQIITFPIKNINEKIKENINKFNIKHASFLYEQSYETPFMPCGYYLKFEFLSNHYKGIAPIDEAHPFKYKDIGLDSIEIYNNENINIISNNNLFKYKIISNREFHNKKNKIILNGAQSEDGNNCLFYIFEEPIRVSYIKFNPLTKRTKSKLNSVKEIKIYCESKIIFEGELYLDHPTVALFTCDTKIKKNIDDKYLTQKTLIRDTIEIKNDQYYSLILN